MQKKIFLLILTMVLMSQYSFSKNDQFDLQDEYNDLIQEVDSYLNEINKTQKKDNALIESIRKLKTKISANSKTYLEEIKKSKEPEITSKASNISNKLEKIYTEVEKDIKLLEGSTGWGFAAANENQRNNALTGLRLSIRDMYTMYSSLRILALFDSYSSDLAQKQTNNLSASDNSLVVISEAKNDMSKGNTTQFKKNMNQVMLTLARTNQRTFFSLMTGKLDIKGVHKQIDYLYQFAQNIQPKIFNVRPLTQENQGIASLELYKANYALALNLIQLSMAGVIVDQNKQVIPSFSDKNILAILPPVKNDQKDVNSVSSVLSLVEKNLIDLHENNFSLNVLSVIKDLLTNPIYRSSFYPVTSSMIVDSTIQALQDRKKVVSDISTSLVPLEQAMMVVPDSASDELVNSATKAVVLVSNGNYSSAASQITSLITAVSDMKNMTYRNGEVNEVVALANLGLLQKVSMLIISNLVLVLNYALKEIGKSQQDLLSPNFDKTITLYKKTKPDIYQILHNKNNIINLVVSIENARLNIFKKLSSNFAQLDSSSQQLALEEGIALMQFKNLITSPNMLGSVASPAVIKDVESKGTNSIVLASSAIAQSLATVKPSDQSEAMTLVLQENVLKKVFTDRTDLLKLSEEMDRPFNEAQDHINKELSEVTSKLKDLSEKSGIDNTISNPSSISSKSYQDIIKTALENNKQAKNSIDSIVQRVKDEIEAFEVHKNEPGYEIQLKYFNEEYLKEVQGYQEQINTQINSVQQIINTISDVSKRLSKDEEDNLKEYDYFNNELIQMAQAKFDLLKPNIERFVATNQKQKEEAEKQMKKLLANETQSRLDFTVEYQDFMNNLVKQYESELQEAKNAQEKREFQEKLAQAQKEKEEAEKKAKESFDATWAEFLNISTHDGLSKEEENALSGIQDLFKEKQEILQKAVHQKIEEKQTEVSEMKKEASIATIPEEKEVIKDEIEDTTKILDFLQELEEAYSATNLVPSQPSIRKSSKPLTNEFMDQVSVKAPGWFSKLSNKQGMITRAMTQKVVENGYLNNEINYINGYLQGMAL